MKSVNMKWDSDLCRWVEDTGIYVNKPISYATAGAAGFDIESDEKVIIPSGKIAKIKTGLRVKMAGNIELQIRPRSGLSSKGIIAILGTVDSDYRGEIQVILHNTTDEVFLVEKGMRIAQGVFSAVIKDFLVNEQEILNDVTERGEKGFGSTGI